MADEEKRPENPESEAGDAAPKADAAQPDAAESEAASKAQADNAPEAGGEPEAQGKPDDAENPPENQPESITQLTGVTSVSASQNPGDIAGYGATGTSEDVEAASPIEPTPGISQDSDSAAASQRPATRLGEEHAGASHSGPHEYVAGHNEHGLSHTTPVQLLIGVFATLTILTILTVAVTGVDLGSQGNFVVAMVIATIKAAIVMAFFMHMLWDSKFNVLVFTSSFLFVLLFLALALADRAEYQRSIDTWETANIVEGG